MAAMQKTLNLLYGEKEATKPPAPVFAAQDSLDASQDAYLEETELMEWDNDAEVYVTRRFLMPSRGPLGARQVKFDMTRVVCHGCGKTGHFKRNCPKLDANSSSSSIRVVPATFSKPRLDYSYLESVDVFFSAAPNVPFEPVAILDSGCTLSVAGSTSLDISNDTIPDQRSCTNHQPCACASAET